MRKVEPAIVGALAEIGVELFLDEGRLKARGKVRRISGEIRAAIREQREELRAWLLRASTPRKVYGAQVIPLWASKGPDAGPDALAWAAWFTKWPDELERLGGVTGGCRADRPEGSRTAARDWARWFKSQPDEFARAVEAAKERGDICPPRSTSDSRRAH